MKEKFVPAILILFTLLSILIQVVLNYTLSKNTSVETFGEYRKFLAITSFSGIFHFGFIDGLYLKWLSKDERPKFLDFISLLIIQIFFLGAIFIFLNQTHFIVSILLQIFIQNLFTFSSLVLQQDRKFIINNFIIVLNQLAITFFIYIFSDKLTLEKIIYLYNIQYFISAFLLLTVLFITKRIEYHNFYTFPETPFLKKYFKDVLFIGFPILLTGLVFVGFQNIDKLILPNYYSKYDFGLYSFGFTIVNIIIGLVLSVTNFILRKFIDMPIGYMEKVFTKLTIALTIVCLIFMFFSPLLFVIVDKYTPQYANAKQTFLSLIALTLPYILLQLLIFNLFKTLNKVNTFFLNSISHLVLLIFVLFICSFLRIKLSSLPYAMLIVFLSWYVVSEYLLCKLNSVFLLGSKYRRASILSFILVNIIYVVFT